jgi:hypothetical protein
MGKGSAGAAAGSGAIFGLGPAIVGRSSAGPFSPCVPRRLRLERGQHVPECAQGRLERDGCRRDLESA